MPTLFFFGTMYLVINLKKTIIITLVICLIVVISILGLCFYYKDDIYIYYRNNISHKLDNIKIDKNEYYNDNNYKFVQNTDDFIVKNEKQLFNVFYTIINSGINTFTFYCDPSYKKCISDVVKINKNNDKISYINNFVHPFNQFNKIDTTYNKYGEVTVKISKIYKEDEINYINEETDKIIESKIKKNMSNKEKITTIHNYIIDKSKYATDNIRNKNPEGEYNKANYILKNKYGTCGAYADLMSVFLYKFKINNIKVSSKTHIWNLVKLNKDWYHVDLTWDDPIMKDGSDRLESLFLLIKYKRLQELNVGEHKFNEEVFKEAI